MSKSPKVIVTRKLPKSVEERMQQLFDVELNSSDEPMNAKALKEAVARADILVPTVTDKIDADVLSAAGPSLKMIANYGAGTDHIDLEAAYNKNITISNTPGVLTEDTADLVMALLLALPRRLVEADQVMRAGAFKGWSPTWMMGRRVKGKKLGIIGMGRIGQAVARRAHAFGLDVNYHNRRRVPSPIEEAAGATYWEDLDRMLAKMDFISVNCPSTPQTRHLLNKERLELISKEAYIINTSRGDVIDEAALGAALKAGAIAGAGLDVYENEPKAHPDLTALRNVIMVPHIGSATVESRREMGEKVIINIRTWLDGHLPPDRVVGF